MNAPMLPQLTGALDAAALIAAVDELLNDARSDAAQAQARVAKLERLRAQLAAAEVAAVEDQAFPERDLVEVAIAANRFRLPPDTIRLWCRTKGIGTKPGGRWRVSSSRLRTLLGY